MNFNTREDGCIMSENIQVGMLLDGRYEIIEKIGTGGMADVYKAKCRLLNRMVAIKALKTEFLGDSDFIRRFETEAQAAASLSHPNIVSVHDVGIGEDINYIVMELAEGTTLKEYITSNGALEWREAVGYASQICSALECAHKKGIIHRDIKPHNIIITKNKVAKVTDFGIARAASGATTVADSAVIGSAHYFSPEQARGGYTDEKSDIYSAGITLYEMLTGRVPFDSDSAVSVAMMHMSQQPVLPRIINPDIPENVEKIVLKAMSKEQHLRYQSAGEMLSDLDAVLSNMPISLSDEDEVVIVRGTKEMSGARRRGSSSKTKTNNKKDDKKKAVLTKSEKRMVWLAIASAIVLLGVIGVVILSWFGGFGSWQFDETVVPAIEGKNLTEAQKLIKSARLSIDIEEEIASLQYEKDTIISQEPAAGRSVKKGSKVRVKVSTGSEGQLTVPNVVNYERENAKTMLEDMGFVVVFSDEESETVETGYVIRQLPVSSTVAKMGDTVRLYVSKKSDKEQVDVPNVIGKSLAQAKNAIEDAGLVVGNVAEQESEQAVGTVIKQSPLAAEKAEKGSAITLTVSKGAAATPEPMKVKTITFPVPQNKDATHVRVLANGKEIHNQTHYKNEINFDIPVKGRNSAKLEIYHDGTLVGTQTINF